MPCAGPTRNALDRRDHREAVQIDRERANGRPDRERYRPEARDVLAVPDVGRAFGRLRALHLAKDAGAVCANDRWTLLLRASDERRARLAEAAGPPELLRLVEGGDARFLRRRGERGRREKERGDDAEEQGVLHGLAQSSFQSPHTLDLCSRIMTRPAVPRLARNESALLTAVHGVFGVRSSEALPARSSARQTADFTCE